MSPLTAGSDRVLAELDLADMGAVSFAAQAQRPHPRPSAGGVDTGKVLWTVERNEHGELLRNGRGAPSSTRWPRRRSAGAHRVTAQPTQKIVGARRRCSGYGWRAFAPGSTSTREGERRNARQRAGTRRHSGDGTWSVNGQVRLRSHRARRRRRRHLQLVPPDDDTADR